MGRAIMVGNRKGGVGKSLTAVSLGVGLARQGKKTLIIDMDSQHSLTVSLGVSEPDKLPVTLSTIMSNVINEIEFIPTIGIIHHSEGVDLMPASSNLTDTELALVQLMFERETVLRRYVEKLKPLYDFIIIDTSPSLDLLAINALAAADEVIIPVAPKFLDAKGLELFLKTVSKIRRSINPNLKIGGILLTMVDKRTNFTREVISLVESAYGDNINIFGEYIPLSVRAAETSAQGVSIFSHDPDGKVAAAYTALTKAVLDAA